MQADEQKTFSLNELFTPEQLAACTQIYRETTGGAEFTRRVVVEVIELALPRINEITGQPNDPAYLAYLIDFAITLANQGSHEHSRL